MASGTVAPPPEPQASPTPTKPAQREGFIETQIGRTRTQVRVVDIAAGLLTIAAGSLAFFFVVALLDHWIISGGLGTGGRVLALLVWLGTSGYYFYRAVLPLVLHRINPLFAAATIEQSTPRLKNSLVNFLMLRRQRREVPEMIYRAMEDRAASDLAGISVDSAVDRAPILRVGYVLAGLMAVFCLYLALSPKSTMTTVGRVVFPWADIPAPTRVTIGEVTVDGQEAGHTVALIGESVHISAYVDGLKVKEDEPVLLVYSTDDGQIVGQSVTLVRPEDERLHQCTLPPTQPYLQQDIEFHLTAGDFTTPVFHIEARTPPSIVVDRVEYEEPPYTKPDKSPRVTKVGDLRAIEGTRVTIHAGASHEIDTADIDLGCNGQSPMVPMEVDGKTAEGRFFLRTRRTAAARPEFDSYQLGFLSVDKEKNHQPVRHRIDVYADEKPRVALVGLEPSPAMHGQDDLLTRPEDEILLLPDGRLTIRVEAEDRDFALSRVSVQAEKIGGQKRAATAPPLLDHAMLDKPSETVFQGEYTFVPADLGLKKGDVVEWQVVAEDNRQRPVLARSAGRKAPLSWVPSPNTAETERRRIRIIDPNPSERPQPGAQVTEPNERPKPEDQPNPRDLLKPGEEEPNPNDPSQPGEEGATPGAETKPGEEGATPGAETKPGEEGATPGAETKPGEEGATPGAETKPGEEGATPGAETKPGEEGATPGAETKPGEEGATPGAETKPGEEGATPGAETKPGEEGATPGAETKPGEEGATPGAETKPGEPGSDAREVSREPIDAPSNPGDAIDRILEHKQQQEQEGEPKPGDPQPGQEGEPKPGEPKPGQEGEPKPGEPKPGEEGERQPGSEGGTEDAAKPSEGESPSGGGGEKSENPGSPATQGGTENGGPKPGEEPTETPAAQGDNAPRSDPKKPEGDQTGQGDGPQSPSISPRKSTAEGEEDGDRSGMGEAGGGQEGSKPGMGADGTNTSADDGGSASDERGTGETGTDGGEDVRSERPTGGEKSDERGAGSETRPGEDPNGTPRDTEGGREGPEGDSSHKPGDTPGDSPDASRPSGEPSREPGQPQPGDTQAGRNEPGGAHPTDGPQSEQRSDMPPPELSQTEPGGEDANLEYSKEAVDLALEHLQHELNKDEPDPELVRSLGGAKKARQFSKEWASRLAAADRAGPEGDDAREALRNLGLGPQGTQLEGGRFENDQIDRLRQTRRITVPAQWADQFREFQRGFASDTRP